jgi:putative DNA methylase
MPVEAINRASAADKSPTAGPHPRGLHRWWGRLPLPAARAIVYGTLVEDPSTDPRWKDRGSRAQRIERERRIRVLEQLLVAHPLLQREAFAAARAEIDTAADSPLPRVLDPCAGGGSIPLEAQRLGTPAEARDINPLAVILNQMQLQFLPRFTGRPAVNSEAARSTWPHYSGIASDVEHYGCRVAEALQTTWRHLYPPLQLSDGVRATAVAYLWARTVPCRLCCATIPLVSRYALATKLKHRRRYLQPRLGPGGEVRFEIRNGASCAEHAGSVSRLGARCFHCEGVSSLDYVRTTAREGGLGYQLLATVGDAGPSRRRIYLTAPADGGGASHLAPPSADFLIEEIAGNGRHAAPRAYGMRRYKDLFTPRQLISLNELAVAIRGVEPQVLADCRGTWGTSDTRPLLEGGTGAPAYAQLVKLCLGFALDRTVEHSTAVSRWRSGSESVTSIFSRPSIPMTWDYAEANIAGASTGSWRRSLTSVRNAISALGGEHLGPGRGELHDATVGFGVEDCVIITDPPFLDNIPYADLAAFFTPWLRSVAGDLIPRDRPEGIVDLASGWSATVGEERGLRLREATGFARLLQNASTAQHDRYPLVVVFASKAGRRGRNPGWEVVLQALKASKTRVVWAWPVSASQTRRQRSLESEALGAHSVLVCRCSGDLPELNVFWYERALKRRLTRHLAQLRSSNATDREQAIAGLTAVEFTSWHVLQDGERPLSPRAALAMGYKLAEQLLVGQSGSEP